MFDGRDPIYLQIADQIRDAILSGALEEDEQVMSTTQYATTYRINPATAQKAFGLLVDQGVLVKRRGLGMFVAPGARELLRTDRRDRFFAEVVDPVAVEAQVLGVPVEDVVTRLRELAATAPQPGSAQGATSPQPTTPAASGATTAPKENTP